MPDWACTRCGSVNLEGQRACEGCGRETAGARPSLPPVREGYGTVTMPKTKPLTDAQNKAAWRITQDVLERRITAEEGRRRLAELFQMPELTHER